MHLKMSSAEVVCKYLPHITDELSIEAKCVDPEQTVPIGAVWCGSTLFAFEASLTYQQTRKADEFCCELQIKGKYLKLYKILQARHYLYFYNDRYYD